MSYQLAVAIDFPGDLMYGPFDRDRMRALFSLYKSWGASRIDWVHCAYIDPSESRCWSLDKVDDHIKQSIEAMGPIFPAAVDVAHELGLRFHCIFKPFDHAIYLMTAAHGTVAARKHGKLDCVGGKVLRATRGLVERQHMQMQRHPDDMIDDAGDIARLELTPDAPARLDLDQLTLIVSDDNCRYQPYDGPIEFDRGANGRIVLSGLSIPQRYLAVTIAPPARKQTFGNQLGKLVRLFDAGGRRVPFTFGLQSRQDLADYYAIRHKKRGGRMNPIIDLGGYLFDTHGASQHDRFLHNWRYCIDNERGYIAMGRGKNRYVIGALSPAHKQVQDHWLDEITGILDAGVDGVDLRVVNHAWPHEFERYGFEPPVNRACRKRYGTDEPTLRQRTHVRADQYTDFYRRAKRLVASRGKPVHVHVSRQIMPTQSGKRYMGLFWQWRKWVNEIADAVTIKDMYAYNATERSFFDTVTQTADRRGIESWYCPNFNVISTRDNWDDLLRNVIRPSVAAGHAGLILYESGTAAHTTARGKARESFKGLGDLLRRETQA